jgi:hypothetical protein
LREGVGVEPTQDLLQPRTGFEDQKASFPAESTLNPCGHGVDKISENDSV